MNDILARLEAMGRTGGIVGVGLSVALLILGIGLFGLATEGFTTVVPLYSSPNVDGAVEALEVHWVPRFVFFGGLMALASFSAVRTGRHSSAHPAPLSLGFGGLSLDDRGGDRECLGSSHRGAMCLYSLPRHGAGRVFNGCLSGLCFFGRVP